MNVLTDICVMISTAHIDINQQGNPYSIGKRYPQAVREYILDLHHNGLSQNQICLQANVSKGFVNKVVKEYNFKNFSVPMTGLCGRHRTALSQGAADYVEVEKLLKPSIYSSELQDRLLLDGVCFPNQIPSHSTLNKYLRNDLGMTKKVISQVPLETTTAENINLQNDYLNTISTIDPSTLHFFDESGVIITTGNRRYGNSFKGAPAVEFQKKASNANFTINLLHSALKVDHFNILDGPSNGFEMLLFFEDALAVVNPDGSVILERGDTVVMDNCRFHHGRFAEGMLRDMFDEFGVNLVFQPPYSPHFNTCELCFNQVKCYLRRHTKFTQEDTKIAIAYGISEIDTQNSLNYFKECGYLL